jgi:hypothetical protein
MTNKDKQALFNKLNTANKWGITPLWIDGIIGPLSNFAFGYASHVIPGWENTSEMALSGDGLKPSPRPYFVDSLSRVDPWRIEFLQSETGALPFAWGRYIDGVTPVELELLRSHGIKWLPISRRSGEVNGDRSLGTRSGTRDASIVARLSEGKCPTTRCVYLDVECTGNPTLSAEYYDGWSRQWSSVIPAVYMPNQRYHPQSWVGLGEAVDHGAPCGGAWVSWYLLQKQGDYSSVFQPFSWDSRVEAKSVVPTIAHQYLGDCYNRLFDFNITKGDTNTL